MHCGMASWPSNRITNCESPLCTRTCTRDRCLDSTSCNRADTQGAVPGGAHLAIITRQSRYPRRTDTNAAPDHRIFLVVSRCDTCRMRSGAICRTTRLRHRCASDTASRTCQGCRNVQRLCIAANNHTQTPHSPLYCGMWRCPPKSCVALSLACHRSANTTTPAMSAGLGSS